MSSDRRSRIYAVAFLLASAFLAACGEEPSPERRPPVPDLDIERPSLERVYAPSLPPEEHRPRGFAVAPAFVSDPEYADDRLVPARRLVYRVSLRVPKSLGDAPDAVPPPTAELYVDLTADRLRARFVGDGWPVEAGSEVRIRSDQPGGYVFDGEGGHPLGPGQLATWFEGGRLRHEPSWRVATPPARERRGAGPILCRFVAEWASHPPDLVARRCAEGGSAPSFRVGLWRAERTADVDVEIPRASLRADEEDPPEPIPERTSHAFLERRVLASMPPYRPLPPHLVAGRPESAPEDGIRVRNRGRARAIVTVNGAPVGWVDAGHIAEFRGLRPGVFRIGAMRPLGLQTSQRRNVNVPAFLSIPR
ncbi:MAG: hypothetical protein OEY14_09355 [Myxococcales bacterium]|nr:hypothetical protein [Myxococcales bacterium]